MTLIGVGEGGGGGPFGLSKKYSGKTKNKNKNRGKKVRTECFHSKLMKLLKSTLKKVYILQGKQPLGREMLFQGGNAVNRTPAVDYIPASEIQHRLPVAGMSFLEKTEELLLVEKKVILIGEIPSEIPQSSE